LRRFSSLTFSVFILFLCFTTQGIPLEKILVLTFSTAATKELSQRVAKVRVRACVRACVRVRTCEHNTYMCMYPLHTKTDTRTPTHPLTNPPTHPHTHTGVPRAEQGPSNNDFDFPLLWPQDLPRHRFSKSSLYNDFYMVNVLGL